METRPALPEKSSPGLKAVADALDDPAYTQRIGLQCLPEAAHHRVRQIALHPSRGACRGAFRTYALK